MNSDTMLKNVVMEFDTILTQANNASIPCHNFDESKYAILYVCIEGGSALANEFAIMTVNENFFSFYALTMFAKPPFQLKHIKYKKILHYENITKLKTRKFLLWQNINIRVNEDGDKYKLKLLISAKTRGIEGQKANLLQLMDFIAGQF